jgi:hypothetical protein
VSLIEEKIKRIESEHPQKNFSAKFEKENLIFSIDDLTLGELNYNELNRTNIVSFFIKIDAKLNIEKNLKSQEKDVTVFDSINRIFEYPFIDKSGSYFVYISDKTYGNRNPFIFNLNTFEEIEIVIPESSEYFPVYLNDTVYFISGQKDSFSLLKYSIAEKTIDEISNGKINCLRIFEDKIYYSDSNSIYKIDENGNVLEKYDFENYIQSFIIDEKHIFASIYTEHQFDIFKYSTLDKSLVNLTNSNNNEVDITLIKDYGLLFSSNDTGIFNLYEYKFSDKTKNIVYADRFSEYYYSFYSMYFKKIIAAVFKTGEEPKFVFIPFENISTK